jgi:hypothetical protein
MKKLDLNQLAETFVEYELSVEEMITIKGGEGDPIFVPTPPSPRI